MGKGTSFYRYNRPGEGRWLSKVSKIGLMEPGTSGALGLQVIGSLKLPPAQQTVRPHSGSGLERAHRSMLGFMILFRIWKPIGWIINPWGLRSGITPLPHPGPRLLLLKMNGVLGTALCPLFSSYTCKVLVNRSSCLAHSWDPCGTQHIPWYLMGILEMDEYSRFM